MEHGGINRIAGVVFYVETLFASARKAAKKVAAYLETNDSREKGRYKKFHERVTGADMKAQEMIFGELETFGLPFQSEEADTKNDADTRWVIDPLDGTENYARGFPAYCVAIALVSCGRVVLGVGNAPRFGGEYCAIAGKGAYFNNKRIRVSAASSFKDAAVFIHPYRRFLESGRKAAFAKLHETILHPRYLGASQVELAMVACGTCDAIVKPRPRLWDVAAGALLVSEAGGKTTDFSNHQWAPKSADLLATNGKLHSAVARLLKS